MKKICEEIISDLRHLLDKDEYSTDEDVILAIKYAIIQLVKVKHLTIVEADELITELEESYKQLQEWY